MHILALHGVPTSPALWARVPLALDTPALRGTLAEQVEAVMPLVRPDTVLVGHDLGGVVAAMVGVRTRPRRVVLCGTALGPYWDLVRATAWPGLWRYFYKRHAGKRFVAGAVSPHLSNEALATFPGADPHEMRVVAQAMCPPRGLARALREAAPVDLLWGSADRWYPPTVARAVARGTDAAITWAEGGHFAMWEAPDAWGAALAGILRRPPTRTG